MYIIMRNVSNLYLQRDCEIGFAIRCEVCDPPIEWNVHKRVKCGGWHIIIRQILKEGPESSSQGIQQQRSKVILVKT